MLYLDKIISQLAYPLNLSLWLALLALVLLVASWRRLGVVVLGLAVAWLWLWSLPVVSDGLQRSLEGRFANTVLEALPDAEAVILLGGGVRGAPLDWPYPDLGASADRVWHAARLYHGGKAPLVVISGGGQTWLGERQSEAQAMQQLLEDLGVPRQAMVQEPNSANTHENALFTAQLLQERGIRKALLVTSAQHMSRAVAAFRAAGMEVVPAPADFEVMPEPSHLLRWLPDAAALEGSTRAIKEFLGIWVYRWRGWAVE